MNENLSDSSKFQKLNIKPGKEINFLLEQEDRFTNFLKKVKSPINERLYKELYPRGSQPGIIYGLCKIHKPLIKNFSNLRSILSAFNTATYGWAKFFLPLLKYFTMNEYTFKDSFEFAVPLDENNKICIDELFKSEMTVSGLNKKEMFEKISLI